MPHPRFSRDEIVERGQAIYEERLRAQLEPEHRGKVLVIDIETGEYEMDADVITAGDRAQAKNPGAALYSMRIGSPVLYRIGGGRRSSSLGTGG